MGKDGSNSGLNNGSSGQRPNGRTAPKSGPAKSTSSKSSSKSGSKSHRRVAIDIKGVSLKQRFADWIASPELFWGGLAFVLFVFVIGSSTIYTRGQSRISVGQIMRTTEASRVEFNTEDVSQTQMLRQTAMGNVPRVYNADLTVLESIRADLLNLPKTLAGVDSLDEVGRDIRVRFGLDELTFNQLQRVGQSDEVMSQWTRSLETLHEILLRRPMLNRQEWQNATQEGLNTQIELRIAHFQSDHELSSAATNSITQPQTNRISREDTINIDTRDQLIAEIGRIVRIAGFEAQLQDVVRKRLLHDTKPTFAYDSTVHTQLMEEASSRVQPVRQTITIGQRLYARGDVLDQASYSLALRENQEFRSKLFLTGRWWVNSLSIYAVVGVLTFLLGGYIGRYCPKILSKPGRIGWMTGLITLAILSANLLGLYDPRLIWLGSITPVVLIAVLIAIAYDQRTSLAISGIVALLVAFSLELHTGLLVIMLAGIATSVAQLGDLRERQVLIRMSLVIACVMGIAAVFDQIIHLPMVGTAGSLILNAVLGAAAQSFIAGLLVGGIALYILPFIEQVFDITTGMTLIELRDPKQPILRELQQRAPGTYNHSLNVASIAESAAEAIGADALLTYVGCLYHDIGKMNKPGYFIENQARGINKHDKLTPAMSLLVIIGHVKDGSEMAREHGLPKSLRHFIEAHHGTTLVEYFYRRAREQASQIDEDRSAEEILKEAADQLPDEVDYRYPGPKPATKEVAITMLSDAVESATRTLKDPTPARIDALVRSLANKRLMDGQFDECDLTFHELSMICESISKTVASIYHGRIRYSSDEEMDALTDEQSQASSDDQPNQEHAADDQDSSPARYA